MSELKQTFYCGQVKASIWVNSDEKNGEIVKTHTISIEKFFKNVHDKWVSAKSFLPEDLMKVSIVAQEAYKYLKLRHEDKPKSKNPESEGQS